MPVHAYYGGHGLKVMAEMQARYGDKKGKSVFYATANKRHQNPGDRPSMKALKGLKRGG